MKRSPETIEQARVRFQKYIAVDGECWRWTGGDKNGYGAFWYDGRTARAHRVAFALFVGPIPTGLKVLHTCDNRKCVNPVHLFVGTDSDNMRDCAAKRRLRLQRPHGFVNGRAKLAPEQVAQIRQMHADGARNRDLAGRFNISIRAIRKIVTGKSWLLTDQRKASAA